jgi:hypothetical protein
LDELRTVVIVTHDIRAALSVSDTVFLLGRRTDDGDEGRGATIVDTWDLVELGLAWGTGAHDGRHSALEGEISARFKELERTAKP